VLDVPKNPASPLRNASFGSIHRFVSVPTGLGQCGSAGWESGSDIKKGVGQILDDGDSMGLPLPPNLSFLGSEQRKTKG